MRERDLSFENLADRMGDARRLERFRDGAGLQSLPGGCRRVDSNLERRNTSLHLSRQVDHATDHEPLEPLARLRSEVGLPSPCASPLDAT